VKYVQTGKSYDVGQMNMTLGHIDNSSLDLLPKMFGLFVIFCPFAEFNSSFYVRETSADTRLKFVSVVDRTQHTCRSISSAGQVA